MLNQEEAIDQKSKDQALFFAICPVDKLFKPENTVLELVSVLLKEGANPNSRSKTGNTPLHFAAQSGYAEVVRLLLQYGAEVDALGAEGAKTALLCTFPKIRFGLETSQKIKKVIEVLLEAKADINFRDK